MLDLSAFDNAVYDDTNYNCLHFAVDVYKLITDNDMSLYVNDLMTGRNVRKINIKKLKEFKPLTQPQDVCLAVMHGVETHCGIYYQNNIIHFNDRGAQSQPPHIAELQHGKIRYYAIPH